MTCNYLLRILLIQFLKNFLHFDLYLQTQDQSLQNVGYTFCFMLEQGLVSDCKETEEYFEGDKYLCPKCAVAKDRRRVYDDRLHNLRSLHQ